MPINEFETYADSPTSPADNAFAIIPHASDELPRITKAIYVGGAGDITLRPLTNSEDVLFKNVPTGMILDVRARAVRASGTTATFLVGLA